MPCVVAGSLGTRVTSLVSCDSSSAPNAEDYLFSLLAVVLFVDFASPGPLARLEDQPDSLDHQVWFSDGQKRAGRLSHRQLI